DVDNLDDSKLDVLLHRARRADVDCRKQAVLALRGHSACVDDPQDRRPGGNEASNAPLQRDLSAEGFGALDEKADIDEADVSRFARENRSIAPLARKGGMLGPLIVSARMRHDLVNDEFGFARDTINDVV